MRLKTRVLIIVLASLFGLVVMGFFGLITTKKAMMAERQAQITLLLDFADAQLRYYHSQEIARPLYARGSTGKGPRGTQRPTQR